MLTSAHPAAASDDHLAVFGRTFQEYRTSRILSTPSALVSSGDTRQRLKAGEELEAPGDKKLLPNSGSNRPLLPVLAAEDGRRTSGARSNRNVTIRVLAYPVNPLVPEAIRTVRTLEE